MPLSDDGAVVLLKAGDNVGVALRALGAGTAVSLGVARIVTARALAAGQSVALRPIAAGEAILRYGDTVGRASSAIAAGEHVGGHNVETSHDSGDLAQAG